MNPKKKKRAKGKRRAHRNPGNPRGSRKRRRAHHNPALRLAGLDLATIGIGAVGGIGTVMAVNAAAPYLPAPMQSGWGKLGTKVLALVLGAFLLPKLVGRATTAKVVTGAGIVVAVDAAREFLAPNVPGLSDLMDSPYELEGYDSAAMNGYGINGLGEGRSWDQLASTVS